MAKKTSDNNATYPRHDDLDQLNDLCLGKRFVAQQSLELLPRAYAIAFMLLQLLKVYRERVRRIRIDVRRSRERRKKQLMIPPRDLVVDAFWTVYLGSRDGQES